MWSIPGHDAGLVVSAEDTIYNTSDVQAAAPPMGPDHPQTNDSAVACCCLSNILNQVRADITSTAGDPDDDAADEQDEGQLDDDYDTDGLLLYSMLAWAS